MSLVVCSALPWLKIAKANSVDGQGQDGAASSADSPSKPQDEIHGLSFHILGTYISGGRFRITTVRFFKLKDMSKPWRK